MVTEHVLTSLVALILCSRSSSTMSAKILVTTVPTHVVEVLAVGERKKVKIAVENLYPHDVQIITLLENTNPEGDKYENDTSSGPERAEEPSASFGVGQPLSINEVRLSDQGPRESLQASASTDIKMADLERGRNREQREEKRAAQGEPQQGDTYISIARPSKGEIAACLLCAGQEESVTELAEEGNKKNFYPCDWLPTNFQYSEGKSVCRLILRMRTGGRAEELKRLQNSFLLQHKKETKSGTNQAPTQTFKGGPEPETVPLVGQRIGKLFSLEDKQARLVTALHFLDKLELAIIHLGTSTASADALAAVALRNALAGSADVDFVEVDEVVYALHSNVGTNSSHGPVSRQALHEQHTDSPPKDEKVTTPVVDGASGADALLQIMSQNLQLARKVVERVRHADFWNSDATDGQGPIVAVIDTGVNYLHPALTRQMWVNKDEEDGIDGFDDDGNGYVDDIYGYNFFSNSGDPMDVDGHGTHCAGIIAARRDQIHFQSQAKTQLLFGVNPDARIMALKFIERQAGFLSDAARSLEYAMQHGAVISSNSWGNASSLSRTLLETVQRAAGNNMLLVAASGNARDGSKPDDLDKTPLFPAALRNDNVLTVAATDLHGSLAPFSNYGRTSVPLAAPGLDIISTWLQDTYKPEAGTSQACPFVAGVASLLYSIKPHSAYSEIKHVLLSTAKRLPSLNGKIAYGLVDAGAAALTMEQLIQAWAVVLEAPSEIPRNGKSVITLQLLGRKLGHHEAVMKILVVYEGLQQGAVELPVSVDVSEPLEYPVELKLGPVVQGLLSLPTSLIMRASPDDKFTLRITKINPTNGDTAFFGFPPPASEYRKETKKSINLLNARCRRSTPGVGKGFLTLSVQRAALFHQWQVRQQRSSEILSSAEYPEESKRILSLSIHAKDSLPDNPSLPAVHEMNIKLTPTQKLRRQVTSEKSSGSWQPSTLEPSVSFGPLAEKLPTNIVAIFRRKQRIASSADQSTTTSSTIQRVTTESARRRTNSIPTQQLTIRTSLKLPSTTAHMGENARRTLVEQPPLTDLPKRPSRTVPALQPTTHIPAGQLTNRSVHVEFTPRNVRNSTTATEHPLAELYTIKFSCEAIDIKVEPHELSAVITPGGIKVFVIQIKKGNGLLLADAEFSLEISSISAVPCAGVHVDPSNKTPLQPPIPVNLGFRVDVNSPAEQPHVSDGECLPSLGNVRRNQTYYYFTPEKAPPAALPHVQFFWNDIREGGQRLTFPPAYAACAFRHVNLGFRFPFWDGEFEDVYVSPHGVVHTTQPNYTDCSPQWQSLLYKGVGR